MRFSLKAVAALSLCFLSFLAFSEVEEPIAEEPPKKVSQPAQASPPKQEFTCSGKRTCGQMNSCAEARFYLTQCGVSSLDRDKDGVPCESICR